MNLVKLQSKASTTNLDIDEVILYCSSNNITTSDFFDKLSIKIAKEYMSNKLDYEYCDTVMNQLWALMTNDKLSIENEIVIPTIAYSIYDAFDAGEYYRKDDDPSIDPAEKYTKPRINDILTNEIT